MEILAFGRIQMGFTMSGPCMIWRITLCTSCRYFGRSIQGPGFSEVGRVFAAVASRVPLDRGDPRALTPCAGSGG